MISHLVFLECSFLVKQEFKYLLRQRMTETPAVKNQGECSTATMNAVRLAKTGNRSTVLDVSLFVVNSEQTFSKHLSVSRNG